eukprot:scaffold1533_cov98-Cylindrotheca_fusiformis.AAC.3
MPKLGRKYRKSKSRKRKDEEEQQQSASSRSISPHPYHFESSPTSPGPFVMDQRSPSPQISDITTDVMSHGHYGGFDETSAVLEYSDTSDDLRGEDRYFSQPINESTGLLRKYSSESTFRTLRHSERESHKVVHYSTSSFEDKSDGSLEEKTPPTSSGETHPRRNGDDERYRWMTSLAYAFRSANPDDSGEMRADMSDSMRAHRQQLSSSTVEFPGASPYRKQDSFPGLDSATSSWESAKQHPNSGYPKVYGMGIEEGHPFDDDAKNSNGDNGEYIPKQIKSRSMAATVAAFYLMDYEAGRPPSLSPNFETISREQLRLYRIQFSALWKWFGVNLAVVLLFTAHAVNDVPSVAMHTVAIIIFLAEIWMKEVVYGQDHARDFEHRDRALVPPMVIFLFALGFESWTRLLFQAYFGNDDSSDRPFILVTALFKPIVFFYISKQARSALEALRRISRIVIRVLVIEVFLILSFAAVACRLYNTYDSFRNLSVSWLSLFECKFAGDPRETKHGFLQFNFLTFSVFNMKTEVSTTVVNPSIWMPMYEKSSRNAFFFVLFIITSATADIHERSRVDREEAIRLAFLALVKNGETDYISAGSVRKTLQVVRPHYSIMKIKALMDIVNPDSQSVIDFSTFRTNIRQALNASVRTSSSASTFAMGVELIAVFVAITNFVYVILLTSEFDFDWFDSAAVSCGSAITLLGLLELVIRFNPLRIPNFAPLTRLNVTFDGIALVGAVVSLSGILCYAAGYHDIATDYILMGRAIDMIRIMRFFQIFRDIVRRSSDVLPAMRGPVILVLTVLHFFVHIGRTLWGGALDEAKLAKNAELTPLYYLNNFNSYAKGVVTMFNVFVVNDWHAIAEVFLICCGVFIMLNVLTAFFVEGKTKLLGDSDSRNRTVKDNAKTSDFRIHTGEKSKVKRVSSVRSLREVADPEDEDMSPGDEYSVASNNTTEIFSFDVYEREGYDRIMAQVNKGPSEEGETFARGVCDYLEVFESLVVGREKVGYMVCCQQSMNRFGNRRFKNNAADYVKEDILHKIVGDMHSELLVLSTRKKFHGRCLVRTFEHKTNPSLSLEIAAALLRDHPAVSLLVSRIRPVKSEAVLSC